MEKRHNYAAAGFLLLGIGAAGRAFLGVPEGVTMAELSLTVLLVIGAPALFSAVPYDAAYNVDFILQIVFTAALLACAFHRPRNRVGRIDGIAFTFLYVAYIVASLLR